MLDKEIKIDKKAVGRRIFNIRQSRGLTLKQFGEIKGLNAPKSIVLRWERGLSLPRRGRLDILAKLGNMTVNQLLYGGSEQDIEEVYQRLIRLSNDEIIYIMKRVTEYVKERKNDYREH